MDDAALLRELNGAAASSLSAEADHLQRLTRGWINERGSPELLPFLTDSVAEVKHIIATTQKTILENATVSVSYAFMANLYQMDLERAKFILRGYLTARLAKIEKYTTTLLRVPEARACLSQEELTYATKFRSLMNQHMLDAGIRELPEIIRGLEDQDNDQHKMVLEPDMNTHVLCRIVAEDGCTVDIDGSPTTLNEGSVFAMPYGPIREFVKDGDIELL